MLPLILIPVPAAGRCAPAPSSASTPAKAVQPALRFATEPEVRLLPVVVSALAQAGPVVRPAEIERAVLDPGEKSRKLASFQVLARSGSIELKGIDTGSARRAAEIRARAPRRFYDATLRSVGGWKREPVHGVLRLRVDEPRWPIVAVRFHGLAR